MPYRKTEVDVRKSKINQRWCSLTLRIANGSNVDQFSFRQLCKSVNFRLEICRVLVRSHIYYVLLFYFLLIRPAQIHSMHMFHTEKKHRNIQFIYSRVKIKKNILSLFAMTESSFCNCWLRVYRLLELFTESINLLCIYISTKACVFKIVIIFAFFFIKYINNYFYFFFSIYDLHMAYDILSSHIIWFR